MKSVTHFIPTEIIDTGCEIITEPHAVLAFVLG